MASEIRVDKINSLSGIGTVSLSPTGVDISGITTAETLKVTTGIVTTLTATTGIVTSLEATTGNITTLRAPTGIVTTLTATTGIVTTFVTNTAKVGAAVTITESGIEASGIGITCANINGGQVGGRRNMVINGAMQISQRGTSFTVSDAFTLDRYKFKINGAGACTITQDSTTPDDFSYSYKVDVTTADTSVAATDHGIIMHVVEGYDFAPANFGSSAAKTCTLSFYVRSNKTGTYGVAFQNAGQNRSCIQEYTINSADTWERKSITIPADTGGSWNTTNGVGLKITWGLMGGSTYATSTLGSYNGSNVFLTSNQVNLFDSTSNEWYMTGAQVEIGSQATSFEHRSLNDELALCQRYFQKYICSAQEWIYSESSVASHKWWGTYFKQMRTQPTVDVSDLSTGSGATAAGSGGNTVSQVQVQSVSDVSSANGRLSCRVTFGGDWGTAYSVAHIDAWGVNDDSVTFSSEI